LLPPGFGVHVKPLWIEDLPILALNLKE
jgi:hypothetical protein